MNSSDQQLLWQHSFSLLTNIHSQSTFTFHIHSSFFSSQRYEFPTHLLFLSTSFFLSQLSRHDHLSCLSLITLQLSILAAWFFCSAVVSWKSSYSTRSFWYWWQTHSPVLIVIHSLTSVVYLTIFLSIHGLKLKLQQQSAFYLICFFLYFFHFVTFNQISLSSSLKSEIKMASTNKTSLIIHKKVFTLIKHS